MPDDHQIAKVKARTHQLKCGIHYFNTHSSGEKNFSVRRDDRGFQRGDIVIIRPYGMSSDYISRAGYLDARGRFCNMADSPCVTRRVTYVLTGGQHGIEPGYVVLGLENMEGTF